jgi:hypothetical protein
MLGSMLRGDFFLARVVDAAGLVLAGIFSDSDSTRLALDFRTG